MKYVYFVSFYHGGKFGNGIVTTGAKMNSMSDILRVGAGLETKSDKEGILGELVILNFQLLRVES